MELRTRIYQNTPLTYSNQPVKSRASAVQQQKSLPTYMYHVKRRGGMAYVFLIRSRPTFIILCVKFNIL